MTTTKLQRAYERTLAELTNLWTFIWLLLATLLGILLLFAAAKLSWLQSHPGCQAVARNLAGITIASVAFATFWQMLGRRKFLRETMAFASLGENIRQAGILEVGTNYLADIDWEEFLKKAKKLDLFFAYAATWRRQNTPYLAKLASSGCRVRIVLPDPDNDDLMKKLSERFNKMPPEELRGHIRAAERNFDEIFENSKNYRIWHYPEFPVFCYYRADDEAVVTLYSHLKHYVETPFIRCSKGRSFFDFFSKEFFAMVEPETEGAAALAHLRPETSRCAGEFAEIEQLSSQ